MDRLDYVLKARQQGRMVEQVFCGQDTLRGEHLRNARANAAHVHYRSIEASHTRMLKHFA